MLEINIHSKPICQAIKGRSSKYMIKKVSIKSIYDLDFSVLPVLNMRCFKVVLRTKISL